MKHIFAAAIALLLAAPSSTFAQLQAQSSPYIYAQFGLTGGATGTGMARDAGNANLPSARTNLGLGSANDVTFHTLTLQGLKQGDMLSVNNLSGINAPTANLNSILGNTSWSTPIGGANNQVFPYHTGVQGAAFADATEATPGTVLLTANALVGANSLTVASITNFKNGDNIWVQLDTGELFSTAVSGAPSGSSVPISPVMPSQASTNNKVYDYYSIAQAVISTGGATANAQKLYAVEGAEFSTSARTGSSVFFKCVLCASQNSDDVVAADGPWDMMLGASLQSGAVGATTGLGFGPWSGAFPVKTTGTLIKTFGGATVANGVDLSNTTFTGSPFKSKSFSIDNSGNVSAVALVGTGAIRTTGVEGSQFEMALGGQEWHMNMASGSNWYVHDVTNNKIPFVINPNSTKALTLGTSTATYSGGFINTGITTDATHTDATVCEDTTTHQFYFGSGAAGICLGTSSLRFKTDVHPLKPGLRQIVALEPINYRYKPGYGGDGVKYGFAAEQVEQVMPELVGHDKEGRPNSVDWAGIVPVLVKAIQEQQREIVALKSRLR